MQTGRWISLISFVENVFRESLSLSSNQSLVLGLGSTPHGATGIFHSLQSKRPPEYWWIVKCTLALCLLDKEINADVLDRMVTQHRLADLAHGTE